MARYSFSLVRGGLRAELRDRDTAAETEEFIRALAAEVRRRDASRVMICVRSSRPIFQVERYRVSEHLRQLAVTPGLRVALVADSLEARAVHEYIEVLARQHGASVRSFARKGEAIDWLRADVRAGEAD